MEKKSIYSKDFLLVAIGQIISLFGNQILRYALPLYLLNQTGSSVLFGTILACSFIPMILFFPIGGMIADRVNKRNIMVVLDFGTAILIFLFHLMEGKIDIVVLMIVTMILLYGIQGAYQPAVKASVPALVKPEDLMKGNSVVDLVNSISSMAGPVIGGVLYSVFGLVPILYVSMGCFLASAAMEIFIHIPFEKKETKGNIVAVGLKDLKDSFRFIFRVKPILWKLSMIYASANLLLTSLILIGVPVIITQYMGFTADEANRLYGYAQGILAGGSVLGGILAGMLSKRIKLKASPFLLTGCALSILAGGIGLQVLKNSIVIYAVLIFSCSMVLVLSTLFQILMMSHLQMLTPIRLTGKVISCVMCVCMCTNPLGQFIYGIVFDKIGNQMYLPFYGAAIIMTVICLFTKKVFVGTYVSKEEQHSALQWTKGDKV